MRTGRWGATLASIALVSLALLLVRASAVETPDPISLVHDSAARSLCSAANHAFEEGRTQEGLILLQKAIAIAPHDAMVRYLLSRGEERTGMYAQSESDLRLARRDGAPDHLILRSLFRVMLSRGEANQILVEFTEPSDLSEKAVDILNGRAEALLKLNRFADAIAALDRSLAIRKNTVALLLRSQIAETQGDLALAARLVDQAYSSDLKNGSAIYAKLQFLRSNGKLQDALNLSQKAVELFPESAPIRFFRVELFIKLNQFPQAERELVIASATAPHAPSLAYYAAILLARKKNFESAWRTAQMIPTTFLQAHPDMALELSGVADKSGHAESAAAMLAAALAQNAGRDDIRLRLAVFRARQDSPQAVITLLTAPGFKPNTAGRTLLATAYIRREHFAEAEAIAAKLDAPAAASIYTEIIRLQPSAVDAFASLGWLELNSGKTNSAVQLLTTAHNLRPKDGEITYRLTLALDKAGNRKLAKATLTQLLSSGAAFDDAKNAQELALRWR